MGRGMNGGSVWISLITPSLHHLTTQTELFGPFVCRLSVCPSFKLDQSTINPGV